MTITEAKTMAIDTTTDATDAARDAGSEIAEQSRSAAGQVRDAVGGAMDRVPDALVTARSGAEQVAERVPVLVERTRIGTQQATTSLQAMPDTTLRVLAAASIGLAAGLTLARAPRLVALAALVPALLAGSAVATRPTTERESD
jgi:hypothetical protein